MRFLVASVLLHLCLLADFRHASLTAPNRHLGQSVLNIQFQKNPPGPRPAALPKTVMAPPVTKLSTSGVAMPAETMADASPSVATADPGAGTSPPESEMTGGLHNQLLGELRTRLSHHLTYPPLARSRGWEGTVLLSLRVEPDGELDRIRLERSSGHALLDSSALNSLKRLGRLVEARVWLDGRSLDMQIPVIFKLIEN
jgi:protein TonB